jgi:putative oxidoreductase
VAFSLLVLTVVATAAVHWPDDWMMFSDLLEGYAITDHGHGNYKLPLIFMVMLVPLILRGAGKLSLDTLVAGLSGNRGDAHPNADAVAWGLAGAALGLPLAMLLPTLGFSLAGAGLLLLVLSRWLHR